MHNQTMPDFLATGFARHVVAWAKEQKTLERDAEHALFRAALLASAATADGHVCTLLENVAQALEHEDLQSLRELLLQTGVVGTCAEPGNMPVILDADGRLYLHRYFDYERRLARRVLAARSALQPADPRLAKRLDALFPKKGGAKGSDKGGPRGSDKGGNERCDWQKVAAALALISSFTVISGGPGTGKTTTVVALLACLLDQHPDCRIALAAPTGKAAARMQEAMRERAQSLDLVTRSRLPEEAFTIHRLLGVTPEPGVFRHHARNPLPIDVLVVDEASMLDIALATKLFEAVPPTAKIILLGDKDQLAAVEAGTVFAELGANPSLDADCIAQLSALTGIPAAAIRPEAPLRATRLDNSVIWLSESHRFSKDSGIGRLAAHINAGDARAAIAALRASEEETLRFFEENADGLSAEATAHIVDGYAPYLAALERTMDDRRALFDAFGRFRVLCALRDTARGVEAMNRLVSEHCRAALGYDSGRHARSPWYPGRPVMIQRNDYTLDLFNGDIGIALPDGNGQLLVWFPQLDGSYRGISPSRLPEHETAFAVTVHKSQGSEFDDVAFVLPAQPHRIACRELVYTAVTRAKKRVAIIGAETVLGAAVEQRTLRYSGLARCLGEAAAQ